MNEMRRLMETIDNLSEEPKEVWAPTTVTAKQVYEWVKTGHWSLGRFEDWLISMLVQASREGRELAQSIKKD